MRSKVTALACVLAAISTGAFAGFLVLPRPVTETLVVDKAATPKPEATEEPLATPEPTGTPPPLVAGTSLVKFNQYGVHVVVADPVADLTYDMVNNGGQVIGLSTRAFIAKYPACLPSANNNALGQISRKIHRPKPAGVFIKQVGQYDYFYRPPSGFCANDQAGKNELATARAALKNAVLPTITN